MQKVSKNTIFYEFQIDKVFAMSGYKLSFAENFALSGVAAICSKTAAAPIERVKLLIQNQDEMIKQVSLKTHSKNHFCSFEKQISFLYTVLFT